MIKQKTKQDSTAIQNKIRQDKTKTKQNYHTEADN